MISGALAIGSTIWSGLRRVPREIWYALAIALALWWAQGWLEGKIEDARAEGATAQAAADTLAFIEAQQRAEQLQAELHAAMREKQDLVTERVDHAHADAVADIDRAAADKLRRHEARQADRRRAGGAEGGAVPEGAGDDQEAYCAAAGWVPFGRALSMAIDAEKDAAQARACAAWVTEQEKAWPDG
jgi:hypothetical protein